MIKVTDVMDILSTLNSSLKKKNVGKCVITIPVDKYSFEHIDYELWKMNLNRKEEFVPSEMTLDINTDLSKAILVKQEMTYDENH